MQRTVYINGDFFPEADARISVFDRGFLFADGIYEVSAVIDGKLVDNERHLARLRQSAAALRMHLPLTVEEIAQAQRETVARNALQEGLLYLQLTRGCAEREFQFTSELQPTLVMFTQPRALIDSPLAQRGARVQLVRDDRWGRCDIKTIQLLSASLAHQAAVEAGYDDAWFTRDGFVTEATAANAFIVSPTGQIITRTLGSDILPGVTRIAMLEIAEQCGLDLVERSFTVDEALEADEAFMSSATKFATGVVAIDEHHIGDGCPGPITQKIRQAYIDRLPT